MGRTGEFEVPDTCFQISNAVPSLDRKVHWEWRIIKERDRDGVESGPEKEMEKREETEWRREMSVMDFAGFCIVISSSNYLSFFSCKAFLKEKNPKPKQPKPSKTYFPITKQLLACWGRFGCSLRFWICAVLYWTHCFVFSEHNETCTVQTACSLSTGWGEAVLITTMMKMEMNLYTRGIAFTSHTLSSYKAATVFANNIILNNW